MLPVCAALCVVLSCLVTDARDLAAQRCVTKSVHRHCKLMSMLVRAIICTMDDLPSCLMCVEHWYILVIVISAYLCCDVHGEGGMAVDVGEAAAIPASLSAKAIKEM